MVPFSRVKAVIFDMDGTLYSQACLRIFMVARLLCYFSVHPWRMRELATLRLFRSHREYLADIDAVSISRRQFSDVADRMGCSELFVQDVVSRWIEKQPLPYLRRCRHHGVVETFHALRCTGRKIVVFSDYPTEEKLRALELAADLSVVATDPNVDRLKPNTLGLHQILRKLQLDRSECLLVGDREERDGVCAHALGIDYLLYSRRAGINRFGDFHWLAHQLMSTPIEC